MFWNNRITGQVGGFGVHSSGYRLLDCSISRSVDLQQEKFVGRGAGVSWKDSPPPCQESVKE